jgi:pantoate--beta-alanine ligase
MLVVNSITQIQDLIANYRKAKKTLGFVPTMGALHQGHISLVSLSKQDNDITLVSIFVNPTQFNDKNDLLNYPRTLDSDLKKLEQNEVDLVFTPSNEEMYPEPDRRVFDFGNLDKVMEGAHRPGHFNGVAQIVSKFFSIVKPNRAYFGEKDFQQLTILRQMVQTMDIPVQIISCPIIREADGLAMSSRNMLLSQLQRKDAAVISHTLKESLRLAKSMDVGQLRLWVIDSINRNSNFQVEYFEIVDVDDLKQVQNWVEPNDKVGCIAVKVGKIRLIDNIRYNL